MAHPNIQLMGATYPDVPSVLLPKEGGGSAQFFDMSDDMAWLGADAQLIATYDPIVNLKLSETAFNGWTPSTTAKDIIATATAGTFSAADLDTHDYYLVWQTDMPIVTDASATKKARPLLMKSQIIQAIFKRPSSWANIQAENENGNTVATASTLNFLRYYGTTQGTVTYTWASSYGFYLAATAATFNSTTAATPTVTVKTPKMSARCSTTYMSTANAGLILQDDSIINMKGLLYKVRKPTFQHGAYTSLIKFINEG